MNTLGFTKTKALCTALLLLSAMFANAQNILETDVLKPEMGQQESILGARVHKVEADGAAVKITVSVPSTLTSGVDGQMEEVIVYGNRPVQDQPRPELPQVKRYEVVNNLESGRSGIIIYLGKNEDFVLTFNYTDDRATIMPGVGN